MYFVEDGTLVAGFYECEDCYNRFLSERVVPKMLCPFCGKAADMEIGPDEEMPVERESAKLLEVVEGENVEKYDTLLAHTITGGDDEEWL